MDNYKDGKVISHESAWRAGTGGARFGLMIPAKPSVGQAFYQEIAPKVAMDRVEVISTMRPSRRRLEPSSDVFTFVKRRHSSEMSVTSTTRRASG